MLNDQDEFEPLITLESVRNLITQYKRQEDELITLNAQRSGTAMIIERLTALEKLLLAEVE